MILVEKLRVVFENVLVSFKEVYERFFSSAFCYQKVPDCYFVDLHYHSWIIEYQLV